MAVTSPVSVTHSSPEIELTPREAVSELSKPQPIVAFNSLSQEEQQAALGLAVAVWRLYQDQSQPEAFPRAFDERQFRLVPIASVLVTWIFVFEDGDFARRDTAICKLHEWTCAIAEDLDMSSKDIVVAYAFVERLVRKSSASLQLCTLRSVILTACVLARKTCSDYKITTKECWEVLWDGYTLNISSTALSIMMHAFLKTADYVVSTRICFQSYANALFHAARVESGVDVPVPRMLDPEHETSCPSACTI